MPPHYPTYVHTAARFAYNGLVFTTSWLCVGFYGTIVASFSMILALGTSNLIVIAADTAPPFVALVGSYGMLLSWLPVVLLRGLKRLMFVRYALYALHLGIVLSGGLFLYGVCMAILAILGE